MAKNITIDLRNKGSQERPLSKVQISLSSSGQKATVSGLPDNDVLAYVARSPAASLGSQWDVFYIVHKPENGSNADLKLLVGFEEELRETQIDNVGTLRDRGTTIICFTTDGMPKKLSFPYSAEHGYSTLERDGRIFDLERLV